MRFLVHSGNSTYSATDKKFHFSLDRRFPNPTRLRISKVNYVAATAETYPTVVYLRSSAIDDLIKAKHTVELTENAHENPSDGLAILEETHTTARYRMNGNLTFPVHGHKNSTDIDFYFTDNTTPLDGVASTGAGSGGSSSVSDADIVAIGSDLKAWIDLGAARTLTANFAPCSAVGDLPRYLYNRSPGLSSLIMYGNWDFELYQMGTNAIGISRDSDPAGGHGQHLSDFTNPTSEFDQTFQVHHIVRTPVAYTSDSAYFKLGNEQCLVAADNNGVIKFKNSAGSWVNLTNITWIPSRTYILSITRQPTGAGGAFEFHWRWEDLDGNTTVTETTVAGQAVVAGVQLSWGLGAPGHYFRHTAGPLIVANGIDTTHYDNSIAWLKAWYTGESTSETEEESTTSRDASFFLQLDIDTK